MKNWFGDRMLGWGWRPVRWQGWAATLLVAVLCVATVSYFGFGPVVLLTLFSIICGFALLCWRTSDG